MPNLTETEKLALRYTRSDHFVHFDGPKGPDIGRSLAALGLVVIGELPGQLRLTPEGQSAQTAIRAA